MTGVEILQAIIEILMGGLTSTAAGIGTALSSAASAIFLQTTGTGESAVTTLSTFGAVVIAFAGVSLGLSLVRLVYQFITSLGARNK